MPQSHWQGPSHTFQLLECLQIRAHTGVPRFIAEPLTPIPLAGADCPSPSCLTTSSNEANPRVPVPLCWLQPHLQPAGAGEGLFLEATPPHSLSHTEQ